MRGTLLHNIPLGAQSWFGCGGAADALFQPADINDLQAFLKAGPDGPITILGGLANTIVRDGGIRGVVIQPDKALSSIEVLNETDLRVQTGALNGSVAAAALKAGIGGLEFLSGIPGKMGGALAMNAGAYGSEVKDVLVSAEGLDAQGHPVSFTPETLGMSYRHTDLPEGVILTSCILRGVAEPYETIKTRLTDIKEKRNATQPIREKTGGSTFANPGADELARAGLPEGTRAWQVVEKVGGRDLRVGGAMMSEQHCNFMINTGSATAADLEALGDELIRRAYEEFGLKLRWEIKRIGEAL
ncbi:MAG TPA: UDP-N-acetylmuramate dehydrogenase [Alphaproteobacteria bacterium]|nr:UDP-N-acetylmuramate dehydrogenase [Alphaproteobacteria bacterium]